MTIRPSRLKYVSYYLSAFLVLLVLYFVNSKINITRDVYVAGFLLVIFLLVLPEILRAKDLHKVTNRSIVATHNFGHHTMSVLHSLIMDVHVIQNPLLRRFPNVGTIVLKTFSDEIIKIKTVKNPSNIASVLQDLSLKASQNQPL
jgi:membrane protein YdbS with pleckstrin-like domain